MSLKKIMLVLVFVASFSCSESSDDCPTRTCSDFTTQSEAQTAFNNNRNCYENLDADDDNIACENLSN